MQLGPFTRRLLTRGSFFPACLVVAAACTKAPVPHDEVDPETRAIQPAVDSDGATLSEGTACGLLLAATVDAEEALECDERETPLACPDLLRASAPACAEYARNTVIECVEAIEAHDDFDDCDDFRQRRCIVTALPGPGCATPDAAVPIAGDAGVGADAAAP
jgi:hypothetical protein